MARSNSARHGATIAGRSSKTARTSASASLTPVSSASLSATNRRRMNGEDVSRGAAATAAVPRMWSSPFLPSSSSSSSALASFASSAMKAASTRPRIARSTTSAARSPSPTSGHARWIASIFSVMDANDRASVSGGGGGDPSSPSKACARFAAAKYRAKSSFARETSGARSSGKSSRYSAAVSPKSSRNEASNEEGDDDDTPEDPDPDPESGSATATLARDSAAATDASSWGRREDKYSP